MPRDAAQLLLELPDLLAQHLVVVAKARRGHPRQVRGIDLFGLQLQGEQRQQVALVVGMVDALHQLVAARALDLVAGAVRVQGAGELAKDLAHGLAGFLRGLFGGRGLVRGTRARFRPCGAPGTRGFRVAISRADSGPSPSLDPWNPSVFARTC